MEGDRIILENQLKDCQSTMLKKQLSDDASKVPDAGTDTRVTCNRNNIQQIREKANTGDTDAHQDDRVQPYNNK